MGYMGLDDYGESDAAFDVAYSAIDAMVEELAAALENDGNEYNTDGPVNVALFFEAFIVQNDNFNGIEAVEKLAKATLEKLNKKIELANAAEWDTQENKDKHILAFKRMAASLQGFINDSIG